MNNFEISNRFFVAKLILFFSIVMVGTIYLKTHMTNQRYLQSSLNPELSEASLRLTVLDTNGQETVFRDVLSVHESTWIYFFSPNCITCKIISKNISKTYLDNFIGVAFTAPSYLSEYQTRNEILFPLYSISPRYANLFGINRIPYLIQLKNNGSIQNEIKEIDNIIAAFNQLKSTKIKSNQISKE